MSLRWATAAVRVEGGSPVCAEDLVAAADVQISAQMAGFTPDLVIVYATRPVLAAAARLHDALRRQWPVAVIVGSSAAGAFDGGDVDAPDLVIMVGHLPEVSLSVAVLDDEELPEEPVGWLQKLALLPEHDPLFLLLADPFSVRVDALLASLDEAYPRALKLGGLASGGRRPREHVLFTPDGVVDHGLVLLTLTGDIRAEPLVAPGCRMLGPELTVTQCQDHVLLGLNGRAAVTVLDEVFTGMTEPDREQFRRGPLVGLWRAGQRPRPGEVLVRTLLAVDRRQGAVGVGAALVEGQSLQFCVRDPQAASAELRALLRGREPAAAVWVFSCIARGADFFGEPSHERRLVRGALGEIPLAGFYSNGELGPVAGRTLLHNQTCTLALLRSRGWS